MTKKAKRPISDWYSVIKIAPHKENARHKPVAADNHAIRELLSDEQKHGVLELAQDIVELNSLDPSSKLIICPDPENQGHFIVLEGNRRITALKTLTNPQLANGLPVANQFKKLSARFLKDPITEVECVELSPQDAKVWIKRKHYKGQGGKGVKAWDPMQRARSDANDNGIYAPWLAATDLLEENEYETSYLLEGIDAKSSTVDRVFSSKHMQELLGTTFSKNGEITFENGDTKQGCELILAMLEEMIKPEFKVTLVEKAGDIEVYLERFLDLSVKKSANDNREIKDDDFKSGAKQGSTSSDKNSDSTDPSPKKKTSPAAKQRQKLAQKGLSIPHSHLSYFYDELTKLPVRSYKHCAAAMLRIFLEKATMVFLEEMKIPHPDQTGKTQWTNHDVTLRAKVKAALNYVDKNKKNPSLKYARDIANANEGKLHSLDILHEYIHDHESMPAQSELITIWDRLHPYYMAIFEALNEKIKHEEK
jgi:hypothetical protein